MERESFVFYKSFYSAISTLPESEQLAMFKAITERALYGVKPNLNGCSKGMYDLIEPQILANERRYLNGCRGAEYGKLGGRPKKNGQTPKKPQDNPTQTPNENYTVTDNFNNNKKVTDNIATKHKYGTYNNVLLTDKEYAELKNRYPKDFEEKINRLSEGIELKGYKYKSHYLAVIKWANNDDERITYNGKNKRSNEPHFDYDQFAE